MRLRESEGGNSESSAERPCEVDENKDCEIHARVQHKTQHNRHLHQIQRIHVDLLRADRRRRGRPRQGRRRWAGRRRLPARRKLAQRAAAGPVVSGPTTVAVGGRALKRRGEELAQLDELSKLPAEYPGWMLERQGEYRRGQLAGMRQAVR